MNKEELLCRRIKLIEAIAELNASLSKISEELRDIKIKELREKADFQIGDTLCVTGWGGSSRNYILTEISANVRPIHVPGDPIIPVFYVKPLLKSGKPGKRSAVIHAYKGISVNNVSAMERAAKLRREFEELITYDLP